jgi:hypothetical protein
MTHLPPSFEIHVHGDVPLRADVKAAQVEEALRPLWQYVGARSLKSGAASNFEEEPGIRFDARQHLLTLCWTLSGNEDFRFALDEMCVGLNEIAAAGSAIEVSFFDSEFDEEDHANEEEARDDFVILFVGPTPADIMQVQRNILVEHVTAIMEQHFDAEELDGVVGEIDKLFHQRFDRMVSSLQLGKPPRSGAAPRTGHKPRRPSH